jgi:tRNA threonylcarbamoyl adenosine modification protein YeaZ
MAALSAPVLALDSSGSFCSVAVRMVDGVIHHRQSDGGGDHFERISALVHEALRTSGVQVADLGHIRIGVGPGSFTGLRIGMSFAKGLAAAAKLPLVGVSSFAAVAQALYLDGRGASREHVLVIADARRDEVFVAEYLVNSQGVDERFAPRIEPVSFVRQWQSNHAAGVVATPNVGFQLADGIPLTVESKVAKGLLLLDVGPMPHFSFTQLSDLEPNYLRAVAAKSIEERRLKGLDTGGQSG